MTETRIKELQIYKKTKLLNDKLGKYVHVEFPENKMQKNKNHIKDTKIHNDHEHDN